MAATHISEKVLREILGAFVSEEQALPSVEALKELSAATGKSQAEIKNLYRDIYADVGGKDDPWDVSTEVQEG